MLGGYQGECHRIVSIAIAGYYGSQSSTAYFRSVIYQTVNKFCLNTSW